MCRFVIRVLLFSFVVAQNAVTVFGFQNVPLDGTRTVNDKPKTPS